MTIAEPTSQSLETQLAEARAALAAAEEAEQRAAEQVVASRERLALGQIVRRALLGEQSALARAQESTEQAKARVRALDRLALAEREQAAKDRAQAIADRRRQYGVEGATLNARVAELVASTLAAFEAVEVAYHELNARSAGAVLAQVRSPSAYAGVYARLVGSLEQYTQLYGRPAAKSATIKQEDQQPE